MMDGVARTGVQWFVDEIQEHDRAAWQALFVGYGEFYDVAMPPEKLDRVWAWLRDADHELCGLVARPAPDADPVGLAHFRSFARPLHGSVGCYLDDLFVAPSARGTGAVDTLLQHLRRRAAENNWDVIRWITRESNAQARVVYDRTGIQTDLVTYDMTPSSKPES